MVQGAYPRPVFKRHTRHRFVHIQKRQHTKAKAAAVWRVACAAVIHQLWFCMLASGGSIDGARRRQGLGGGPRATTTVQPELAPVASRSSDDSPRYASFVPTPALFLPLDRPQRFSAQPWNLSASRMPYIVRHRVWRKPGAARPPTTSPPSLPNSSLPSRRRPYTYVYMTASTSKLQ